jgi:nitrilase
MPLARYALYAWGVNIYVASTWDSSDGWMATLRHIAKEGRCTVIGCCIAMKRDQIPDSYAFKKLYPDDGNEWVNRGSSAIVNPAGILAGPVLKEEKIIYAEIDPVWMRGAKFSLDAVGHYARPDVFQLTVNREENPMLNVAGGKTPANGHKAAPAPRKRRQPTK